MNNHLKITLFAISIFFALGCGWLEQAVAPKNPTPVAQVPAQSMQPTFTPTVPLSMLIEPTPTFTPVPPTNTPTPIVEEAPPTPAPPPTDTPAPKPAMSVGQIVNVRSGPGTNYPVVGQVAAGHTSDILGRNANSSWLFINHSGGQGWLFAQLAQIEGDVNSVGVQEAAAPPAPQAQPQPQPQPADPQPQQPPPEPAGPQYAFKLTNMFGEVNEGITQIRGYITDSGGNPYNGARVRVRSGSFCTVSVPSGKAGVYPAGNYDVLLDVPAKPGNWQVSIVDKPSDPNDNSCDPAANLLSEEVNAPTDRKEGVVYVEFQKR